MKRPLFSLFLLLLLYFSCNTPEPRRPLSVRTGTFMKESIERNKDLLAQEEAQIMALLESDSVNEYLKSPNGYWYTYKIQDSLGGDLPAPGDLIRISYDLRTLSGDTIYSTTDIGELSYKVDKETYFPGLRTAVKMLRPGESATFFFPSSLGYGYHGDEKSIGPNTPLVSTITYLELLELANDSIRESGTGN